MVRDMGVRLLRYGPPTTRCTRVPIRTNWEWTDPVIPVMREMGIVPVMDLCHLLDNGMPYRTLIHQWNNLPLLPNGPFSYAGVSSPPSEREVEWPAERTRAGPSHVSA